MTRPWCGGHKMARWFSIAKASTYLVLLSVPRAAEKFLFVKFLIPPIAHSTSPPSTNAGHRDSVTCTGFSHDGKYLATADMGGLVQVWSVSNWQVVCTFETSDIEVGK